MMFSFVVVAARGSDLVELPLLRERYSEGDLRDAGLFRGTFVRVVATRSEATPVAAAILSLAT